MIEHMKLGRRVTKYQMSTATNHRIIIVIASRSPQISMKVSSFCQYHAAYEFVYIPAQWFSI